MFQKCAQDDMKSQASVIPITRNSRRGETILEVNSLHRVFPVGHSFLTALADVSFNVDSGEFICLLGRSGCGKSTLLKVLAGFIPPTSGTVFLHGRQVAKPSPDRCVVFQEDALFPWLTVRENVAFGMKGKGLERQAAEQEVDGFLALVGLNDFADYLPRQLSGGMKQRVALARVLILRPQVLLMDEPFASLDALTREEMQNHLLMLWERFGHTILFVTHDVHEAVTLADRVLVMNRALGTIHEELEIHLPRQCRRDHDEFLRYTRRLIKVLRECP